MKTEKIVKLIFVIISTMLLVGSLQLVTKEDVYQKYINDYTKNNKSEKPSSFIMYENLEKYSEEYEIPKHIIYNIAYKETSYKGPFDLKYTPNRTSSVGAVGPMQIMPSTANSIHKKKIPIKKLKLDIEFNIETSTKLLKRLYLKYGDWQLVCGYYNTGKPIINDYAIFCSNNLDYQKNWVYLD